MNSLYSIQLRLEGRTVLVIGGGRVATRRLDRLLETGARVRVVSPSASPEISAAAQRGAIEWNARAFHPSDLDDAFLALLAVGDADLRGGVLEAARARGVLVNAADDRDESDFHLPAVAAAHGVRVAVSTEGRDPALARRVRASLEDWLAVNVPPMRSAFPRGSVALVGAGPGDPGLLTIRGRQRLAEADIVFYDRLVGPGVLEHVAPGAEMVHVGKTVGCAQGLDVPGLLIDAARRSLRVVRLKGGDPLIFGRGGEEMRALRDAGIPYELVPGVSALTAVSAAASIPVTYRDLASEVIVRSGHGLGGEPRDPSAERRGTTWVYFMAVAHLEHVVAELAREGVAADTPVAIVERGTLDSQRVITGRLDDIARRADDAAVEAPALLIAGEVVLFPDPRAFEALLARLGDRAADLQGIGGNTSARLQEVRR